MSGSATVFDAKVRGVDAASGPFTGIIEKMRGLIESTRGLTAATRGLSKASAEGASAQHRFIATLGAHMHVLRGHIGSVNAGIVGIRNSISGLLPMIGALGAGASLAGLFELTKSVAEASVELEATAQKTGNTIKGYAGLAYAAKLSAVPVETMTGGLEKLNKTLGTTIVGKNKVAAQLFHHLGISLKDAQGHVRTTADLMPQLADAFMKTRDPAMRAFMATTLFSKAGQELLPVLMQGKDALAEFAREGARLAYIATPEQRKGLREFEDGWIGLQTAVGGFKTELGASLAPALAPLVALAKEWVVANRDWIATGIADKVGQLGKWLRHLDLEEIVRQTTEWFHGAETLVESLGGLKTIVGALILAMGSPLLDAVTSAISVLGSLGGAVKALTLLMAANPFLLIIAAVALLGVAAYELWNHWDWVKGKFAELFRWFTSQDAWVQTLIAVILPFISLPVLVYEHWEPIKAFFVTLWDGVKSAFQAAWDYIKPIIDDLKGAVDWVAGTSIGKALAAGLGHSAVAAGAAFRPDFATPAQAATDYGADPDAMGYNPFVRPSASPPPSLYREGGPAASAAAPVGPQTGTVTVKIEGSNLAPGTTVNSTSSGIAQVGQTNVGYTSPMPERH